MLVSDQPPRRWTQDFGYSDAYGWSNVYVTITARKPTPEQAAEQARRQAEWRARHDAEMEALMDGHVALWGFWLGQAAVWADAGSWEEGA